MTSSILLPTNKLYESANFGDFQNLAQAHLASSIVDYASKSDAEKWTCIMDAFVGLNSINNADKQRFVNFKTNRLQSNVSNRYILTMKQSLIYFESYYFLYNNIDSEFKLSDQQRESLIKDIVVGMSPAVCEPGKTTHFENTIQRARSDMNNWLQMS